MKSKEREILRLLSSEMFESGLDREWKLHIKELLAQPEKEQTPCAVSYDDIFDDLKYLIMGFENGADAADYSSEISRARSDMRKARNRLHQLPTDVIDDIAVKSFYAGTFDFRIFAKELEKQHGIGFDDE